MLVSDVSKQIDASENTIRNFISKNEQYSYYKSGVIHVTDEGFNMLQKKYGLKAEVLTDNDVEFYRSQIASLQSQLDNQMFQFKIYQEQLEEQKNMIDFYKNQLKIEDEDNISNSKRIRYLEEKLHKEEIEKQEIQHKLEMEINKSIWQKIFKK